MTHSYKSKKVESNHCAARDLDQEICVIYFVNTFHLKRASLYEDVVPQNCDMHILYFWSFKGISKQIIKV